MPAREPKASQPPARRIHGILCSVPSFDRQRSILARVFEHDKMKRVFAEILTVVKSGGPLSPELNTVALNFIRLQQHRHTADYDNSQNWSHSAVETISMQDAAQEYLLQMFLPKWPSR